MNDNIETNWGFRLSKITTEFFIEGMSDGLKLFWLRVLRNAIVNGENEELSEIFAILVDICDKKGLS